MRMTVKTLGFAIVLLCSCHIMSKKNQPNQFAKSDIKAEKGKPYASSDLNVPALRAERHKASLALNLGAQHLKLGKSELQIRFKPVQTECAAGDVDIMLMSLINAGEENIFVSLESMTSEKRYTITMKIQDFVAEIPAIMRLEKFDNKDVLGLFICQTPDADACKHGEAIDPQEVHLKYLKKTKQDRWKPSIFYYQTIVVEDGKASILDPQLLQHYQAEAALPKLKSYLQAINMKSRIEPENLTLMLRLNQSINSVAAEIDQNTLILPLPFNSSLCEFPGSEDLKALFAGVH